MTRIKTVSPIYCVSDPEQTCTWYKNVLGFDVVYAEPDRSYVVVSRDGRPIHFICEDRLDVLQVTKTNIELYIEVEGINELYDHACKVTDTEVSSLEVKPWGMLEFQIKDPDGALIRIGESV